jgi:hypothetical protein
MLVETLRSRRFQSSDLYHWLLYATSALGAERSESRKSFKRRRALWMGSNRYITYVPTIVSPCQQQGYFYKDL